MTIDLQDRAGLRSLRDSFSGTVFLPSDDGYESARHVFNALATRRPAVIARCSSPSDVQAAVDFAREESLPVSIRSGGHAVSGSALCDDGVCIDMTGMKGIAIDPDRRVGRVDAGVTWGEFDA